MTLADVEAVMSVEVRAYSHPWSRGNFVDSLLAGYVAEVLQVQPETPEPHESHKPQPPHAALCGYFVAMPGADELHLLNITVAPESQLAGLGRRLLQVVQDRARERGLATLWLEVRQGNQRARHLYRRIGFEEVGLRKGYYAGLAQREDAVVMRLHIPQVTAR